MTPPVTPATPWTRTGGATTGPLLVLLHGLAGNAEVWHGLEALLPDRWDGGWLAVDLPGHGRSPRAAAYGFADHADAVAAVLPVDREVTVLGHSMGGMVGLALAARHPAVRRVLAFSVKTSWPPEQVAGMQALATRQPKVLPRAEAAALLLKVSGLQGLVATDHPVVDAGLTGGPDDWRLAQDPATYAFGAPDVVALLEAVACPVLLARGAEDRMVPAEDVSGGAPWVAATATWPGLGHNPHVEDPATVAGLLDDRPS